MSLLGPSPGKQRAQKTRRDVALIRGDGPVIDNLQVPMVLSSSQSTPENKKSLGKSKVCPRHPLRTSAS
jgi:hypothetical protein